MRIAEHTGEGTVYRYMTSEEEAAYKAETEKIAQEQANRMPTEEERLAALEDALAEMMEVMFG